MTTETANKSEAEKSSQAAQAKLDALIADVDLSDVPENIRADVKKALAQKVKLYDAGYRAKTETLAEEKKRVEVERQSIKALLDIQRELKDNPSMEKAVIQTINDYRSGKINKSDENRDKAAKRLDKLIDNATDPDTREQLREMRQIVIEETDAPALKGELAQLRAELNQLKSSSVSSHAEKVEAEIDSLEKEFGKEIVSKYREEIKSSALKFPQQKVKKLLYHFAEDSEIEDAILKGAEGKRKRELEIKKNGSLPDGRSMSTKVDVPKDSRGRVNWRGFISNMKTAGKFDK